MIFYANFSVINTQRIEEKIKFPYSILLAEVGMMFAAIGWMLSIVMSYKLRKKRSQCTQDLDLSEATMISQDPDNTEAADTPIIGSQACNLAYTPIKKITES